MLSLYLGGEEQRKYLSSYETKRDKQLSRRVQKFCSNCNMAEGSGGFWSCVLMPSSRAYLVLLSSGHGEPLACLPRPNRPLLVCLVAQLCPNSLQPSELYAT